MPEDVARCAAFLWPSIATYKKLMIEQIISILRFV